MDPQPLLTKSKLLSHCSNENFPQDSQPSMIHNSRAESLHQLKEPLLAQPIQIHQKSSGSKTILRKVKDIDKRLEDGWVFAYELWLYIIIVLAPSKTLFMCAWMCAMWEMITDRDRDRDHTWFIAFSILLIFALYYTYWTVRQALLHKEALRKKDEKIATKAYDSLVRLSIHYFILCVIFLIVGRYFGYYSFKLEDGWKGFLYECGYPTFQFVSHYAIPVPISIYGSKKIKILLEERKNLIGETETIQQPSVPLDPLDKKLEEIDSRLDRGWLFLAYKIWLYLTPLLGIFLYETLYESQKPHYYRREGYRARIFRWGLRGYALHCIFWLLKQAWCQIIAMKQKDAKLATKAYDSLVWLARYYSIWMLFYFWDFVKYLWLVPAEEIKYAIGDLIVLSDFFIRFYGIPVGISIYGSKQVKNLLKEKQALIPDDEEEADSSESKI